MKAIVITLSLILSVPAAHALPTITSDNDAGSHRDAPDAPDPTFLVPARTTIHGNMSPILSDIDVYGIAVDRPARLEVLTLPNEVIDCPTVLDPEGRVVADQQCDIEVPTGEQAIFADLTHAGVWYVAFADVDPSYTFTYAIGDIANSLVIPSNDAGSGRDAPDDASEHVRIAPGVVYEGNATDTLLDVDHYAFVVDHAAHVEARLAPDVLCQASFQDARGVDLPVLCASDGWSSTIDVQLPAAGLYYLAINGPIDGPYFFSLGIDAAAPGVLLANDAGSGTDAPSTTANAVPIEAGPIYDGTGTPLDIDTYSFHAAEGSTITIAYGPGATCDLQLLDTSGVAIEQTCFIGTNGGLDIIATAPASGTFYAMISPLAPVYRFSLSLDGSEPSLV